MQLVDISEIYPQRTHRAGDISKGKSVWMHVRNHYIDSSDLFVAQKLYCMMTEELRMEGSTIAGLLGSLTIVSDLDLYKSLGCMCCVSVVWWWWSGIIRWHVSDPVHSGIYIHKYSPPDTFYTDITLNSVFKLSRSWNQDKCL